MEISFLCAENGYYMKRTNPLFISVTPVKRNPEMPKIEESITFIGAKIPVNVFRQWLDFAKGVAERHSNRASEAALMLFYHPTQKRWSAYPPKQKLTLASVDYSGVSDAMEVFRQKNGKEWMMAGTFHSHPGLSSEPSATDIEDEKDRDGVHIIVPDFGRQDAAKITAHATAGGVRFAFRKVSHLIDFSQNGEVPKVPEEWYSQITFGSEKIYSYSHTSRISTSASSTPYDTWLKEHNLREPNKVLRMLGFSKPQIKELKKYKGFFEKACLILDEMNDHARYLHSATAPLYSHEVERLKTDVGMLGQKIVDFIDDAARWLLPDEMLSEEMDDVDAREKGGDTETDKTHGKADARSSNDVGMFGF